jgi:hypothetical protein
VLSKIKRLFYQCLADVEILELPEKQFFNTLSKLQEAALTEGWKSGFPSGN